MRLHCTLYLRRYSTLGSATTKLSSHLQNAVKKKPIDPFSILGVFPPWSQVVQYMELFKKADPDVDQVEGDGYHCNSKLFGPGSGERKAEFSSQ